MNIAYMILAHHQPQQLQRLVDRLNQINTHFFIHIDKKSGQIVAIRQLLASYANVHIISNNEVNWMGFTTIDAELDLMKLAMASGINFKYFVLMSGQDYPIKNNDYINSFFAAHNSDFLSYNNISYLPQSFKDKVTLYHFRDIPYINPRNPKKIAPLVYLYFGLHNKIRSHIPRRKFFKDFEPYFGSQWFALTQETIKYILNFVAQNPAFIKAMKNTDGPDEVFFQTIIMNSERKQNVYGYQEYLRWLEVRKDGEVFSPEHSSLRYMDWSERPGKSKPAVLDDGYFQTLLDTGELYARKLDEATSIILMDKLDNEVLGFPTC